MKKIAIPIILMLLIGLLLLVACANVSNETENDTVTIAKLKAEVGTAFDKLTIANDLLIDSERGIIAFTVENDQSEIVLSEIKLSSGSFTVTSSEENALSVLTLNEGINTYSFIATSNAITITYTLKITRKSATSTDPASAIDPEHTHTYAEEWSYDEEYHWHAMNCGCEDNDEIEDIKSDYYEHIFNPSTHECECGRKEQIELVFVDYNERVLNTLTVDYGSEITLTEEVESPERSNYVFKGWQLNDASIERYNAISEATFYASYKGAYTVLFVANGTIIESQLVEENCDAVLPLVIPKQDGYIFTGWEDCTQISEDKTIYAQFDPISYNVRYIMPDGKQIGQTQTVNYGATAIEPSADVYWFNSESYHLYLFTSWGFAGMTEWNYSDIEHDVVLQYNNDPTKTPVVNIEAVYNTEYQLPVVLIESGTSINDATITINLSIILPSGNDCFIYGCDLRFSYVEISISGDALNTGSVFYDRTLTSDYNNKAKDFTLVWTSNNSGINYSNQQIIDTITINRPNKQVLVDENNFILQDESSLVIASTNDAAYESMQKIIPIVVYK